MVAALAGGAGVVAYALMWVFLPLHVRARPARRATRSAPRHRAGASPACSACVALGLGILLALAALGAPIRVSLWAPVLLFGAGVVVLWRQSDEAQRAILRGRAQAGVAGARRRPSDRVMWLRVLIGARRWCWPASLAAIAAPRGPAGPASAAMAAAGVVVAGLALIALPWISAWVKRAAGGAVRRGAQ